MLIDPTLRTIHPNLNEYFKTDALEFHAPALAHGVNIMGLMGGGIALQIAQKYPMVESAYRNACETRKLRIGGCFPVTTSRAGAPYVIYNLATQVQPGPHGSLTAVDIAIGRMVEHALDNGIDHIAMPRIGCGIGGLRWQDVMFILNGHCSQVKFSVCSI